MTYKMAAKSLKFQLFAHQSFDITHFDFSVVLGLTVRTHRSQNLIFEIQDGGSYFSRVKLFMQPTNTLIVI